MNHLIFASCDGEYYRQFGTAFCKSAIVNGHRVHVHIVNSQGVITALQHQSVSYSFEESAPQTREYYASSRFLLAPKYVAELVDEHEALLILDIDSLIRRPFDLPKGEVGLYRRAGFETPSEWVRRGSRVAAGAVCYRRGGLAFAEGVAARLTVLPQEWLVDQVALAETADDFEGRVAITNLAEQPDFFDVHHFRETSAIWSGKGRRKLDRVDYVEETERWRSQPL